MFHDNLIALRKQRGMSQEFVAERLHVVRQTVSKWERGISVPDAEMLTRIADLFGVSVSELLGEAKMENINEVAVQLALLNEQLANRSRRIRAIWKGVLTVILVLVAMWLLATYGTSLPTPRNEILVVMECTLDGQTYSYSIGKDKQGNILQFGGDPWLHEQVHDKMVLWSDADSLIQWITAYVESRGGTVKIQELDASRIPR